MHSTVNPLPADVRTQRLTLCLRTCGQVRARRLWDGAAAIGAANGEHADVTTSAQVGRHIVICELFFSNALRFI